MLVAAFRSRQGASCALLERLAAPAPGYERHVSVPLVLEYEDVLRRQASALGLAPQVVDNVLDFACVVAHHQEVLLPWRLALRDPGDDMVLQLAVAAAYVVTFGARDVAGAERFGVRVIPPRDLLRQLESQGGRAMSTISLRPSESLHARVRAVAEREGISIKQPITTALAEKVSALLTEDYLRTAAARRAPGACGWTTRGSTPACS